MGPFELNEAQLTALGQKIGATVELPVIFALHGDLGAGKSVLARGIAQGAGVRAHMPSPTFNLLFQYEAGDKVVSHLDLYRLEDPGEVWELGWRDLGVENQIVLIEWPERAHELLPEPRWDVFLAASENGALLRRVSFRAVGDPPPLSIDTP